MKSWTSAFSVSSPIAALGERWMQPGWCVAAPGPRGFPFPSCPAPPRLALPRAARAEAASRCWLLLPGPRDLSPRPAAGGRGGGRTQPARWLRSRTPRRLFLAGSQSGRRPGEVLGVCPSQADPGLLRWAKRLGDEDPNSAHRGAGRILGSRCSTLRTGCLRASMLTNK